MHHVEGCSELTSIEKVAWESGRDVNSSFKFRIAGDHVRGRILALRVRIEERCLNDPPGEELDRTFISMINPGIVYDLLQLCKVDYGKFGNEALVSELPHFF